MHSRSSGAEMQYLHCCHVQGAWQAHEAIGACLMVRKEAQHYGTM
jgi:hypothetical protein